MNTTAAEPWFIPVDILMISCACIGIACNIICLSIMIFDKTCRTVSMMFAGNTLLSALLCTCTLLSMAIFTLENDLKQIVFEDSLCSFRTFMIGSVGAIFNYSFFLQSLYRYIRVVYPRRLFYQSVKFQLFLISTTWVYGLTYGLVFLIRDEIVYDVDNQICQSVSHLSFSSIYGIVSLYLIPISLTVLVYLKLVRHVKRMQANVTVANTLIRAKNELRMVARIIVLITILIVICFPHTIFILLSFFDRAPKYKYRMGYLCVDLSIISVNITLIQFTDPLKSVVTKIIRRRRNIVAATVL